MPDGPEYDDDDDYDDDRYPEPLHPLLREEFKRTLKRRHRHYNYLFDATCCGTPLMFAYGRRKDGIGVVMVGMGYVDDDGKAYVERYFYHARNFLTKSSRHKFYFKPLVPGGPRKVRQRCVGGWGANEPDSKERVVMAILRTQGDM